MKKPNTPAAMERVKRALQFIESAQGELSRASQELSALRWGSGQQTKVMKLYDKVHQQWYVLRKFSEQNQSLSVDSEPE